MVAEWLCTRCAGKLGKEREAEPTILRICSNCGIENWVRPFGHAGQDVVATEEEKQAALEKAIAESTAVAEPEVVAETVPEVEVVEVLKEASKEDEIAALRAKLAELEGEK
jgi:predicted  nucleic acid-binding Zn-ribbon protein